MKTALLKTTVLLSAVLILGTNVVTNAQIQKGADIDGEAASDQSGHSVSMPDANTIAIGAPFNDGNGNDNGHVRVYTWNGSAWVQKGSDIDGEAGNVDQSGYTVSMPDANTVGIGAIGNDDNGVNSGHVRVYSWNGNAWVQKGLDLDGELANDFSGYGLSMPDANTVAIGAPYNPGSSSGAGHVRIYAWNGNAWQQKGTDINGEAAGDDSGHAVSMPDANTVAIGAAFNDGNGNISGQVRIFTWNGSSWVKKGMDIDGLAALDGIGYSVSMPDANTVATGSPMFGGFGFSSGRVRVFSWNGSAWVQKGMDIAGEGIGDWFGVSVSMPDPNTVAIGADKNDGNGNDAGHARIYSWTGSAWLQTGPDFDAEASTNWYGRSVSMPDANTVAIGGSANNGVNGNFSGHVRVFTGIYVGIEQNDFGNTIVAYPNPGEGQLSVDLGSSYPDINVIVRNIIGQEVLEYGFNNTCKFEITLPEGAGTYFISVNTENNKASFKVVRK